MEIYLDDCSDSDRLVAHLESVGFTVHTPRSEHTLGVRDPDHLAYAAAHAFTLITANPRDFRLLHEGWLADGRAHSGILLVYQDNDPTRDMTPADITRAVRNLAVSGIELENEVLVLNDWQWEAE